MWEEDYWEVISWSLCPGKSDRSLLGNSSLKPNNHRGFTGCLPRACTATLIQLYNKHENALKLASKISLNEFTKNLSNAFF